MAGGELRLYKPSKDVESRYNANAEQYHDENTDIASLKKGHYQTYNQADLEPDQLKLQQESQDLWNANHTFLWNWDGISDKVKKLARHRNLDVMTKGIVQQYHALIAPPLAASCGHRCTFARSELANQSARRMNYVEQYQKTYYGEGTKYPEGITQENFNSILKDIGRANFQTVNTPCCRCVNAEAWFGLAAKDTYQNAVNGVLARSVVAQNGILNSSHLRMDKGEWYAEADSNAYYATISAERKIDGHLDTQHIGWHAGLLRPRFHYRERNRDSYTTDIYSAHRPQYFSSIRLLDGISVISGLHNPKRYLCPNCFTAAKGLSPHLYWLARGHTFKEAKFRQQREFEIWQQGKTKRWMQNTSLHIKDWAKFPHAYGI